MSYTCRYLKFGSNLDKVPGYDEDLILSNKPYAPIPKKLVDPYTDELWGLIFSYEAGKFYRSSDPVPGTDNAIIKSWYARGGNGGHYLALTPFIIGEEAEEGFIQSLQFVDFSETPTTPSSINTDTIKNPTVTATVHQNLPEFETVEFSTKSTSHAIIITSIRTEVLFDQIFVYWGNSVPNGSSITVPKGQSCYALAVFKKVTSVRTEDFSTYQWPRIPRWEWPMIVNEIIKDIAVKGNGEIFEHLSPKYIVGAEPETLKKAIASIDSRVESLEKVKAVIAGLAGRKVK